MRFLRSLDYGQQYRASKVPCSYKTDARLAGLCGRRANHSRRGSNLLITARVIEQNATEPLLAVQDEIVRLHRLAHRVAMSRQKLRVDLLFGDKAKERLHIPFFG